MIYSYLIGRVAAAGDGDGGDPLGDFVQFRVVSVPLQSVVL